MGPPSSGEGLRKVTPIVPTCAGDPDQEVQPGEPNRQEHECLARFMPVQDGGGTWRFWHWMKQSPLDRFFRSIRSINLLCVHLLADWSKGRGRVNPTHATSVGSSGCGEYIPPLIPGLGIWPTPVLSFCPGCLICLPGASDIKEGSVVYIIFTWSCGYYNPRHFSHTQQDDRML